jgi:signal transduction histidine kinase
MRHFEFGFRWRLTVAFVGFAALLAVGVGSALYHWVEYQEEQLIDEIVTEELAHLRAHYERDPTYVPGEGRYLSAYVLRPGFWPVGLPESLRTWPAGLYEIETAQGEWHVGVQDLAGGVRLLVRYDARAHEEGLVRFATGLIVILASAVAAAGLLAYAIAARLVRPLETLAARIERLPPPPPADGRSRPRAGGGGEPAAGLPVDGYRERELVLLARAFEGYHRRMEELLRREQEFSEHLSHELRTPLSVMRSALELIATEPDLAARTRERIARLQRAVVRLEAVVRTLFFLSSRDRPAEPLIALALRSFLEEWLVAHCPSVWPPSPAAAGEPPRLVLDVAPEVCVLAPRTALELVVGNLLTNALTHAGAGPVRVSWQAGVLSVEDRGRGIGEEERARLFERFYRGQAAAGHEGLGIGLALAKRLSELYGWCIAIENLPQGGTRASIVLPVAEAACQTQG